MVIFCRINHSCCLNILSCIKSRPEIALWLLWLHHLDIVCVNNQKPFVFKKRIFPSKVQFWKTVCLDWLHSLKAVKDNKFCFSALHTNKERIEFFKPICGLFIESNVCQKILIYLTESIRILIVCNSTVLRFENELHSWSYL